MTLSLQLGILASAVTALRVLTLYLSPTDLFFDEAQYWLWGQTLDFGYYSKPPMIAWLIRAVTELAGSIEPFWVRLAAPILHGVTGFVLGLWVGTIHRPAAIWTTAIYLSMPIVAVGSWMISTDTVMAPFFALALWAWWRHLQSKGNVSGVMAGLCIGLAMMSKYAAIYFWAGTVIVALVFGQRPTLRGALLALAGFLIAIMPNLLWNFANNLSTLDHTMDNADWVREGNEVAYNWSGLLEFLGSQIFVIGPVFFFVWLAALVRRSDKTIRWLLAFSIPVLLVVCAQAFLSKAYANWAFAAYLTAVPLVALALTMRGERGLLWSGLGINVALCLIVSALIVVPSLAPRVTDRYVGRAEMMSQIIDAAAGRTIVASHRHLLADLFYTRALTGAGSEIFSIPPEGRAKNFYAQTHPWPAASPAVFVGRSAPVCNGRLVEPEIDFDAVPGAYGDWVLAAYPIEPDCDLP
ncbi:MAG: glycosyltransferase family 39 protein [Pseudomonadota bacterium]